MPFIDVPDGRLFFETHGTGEPLLLVTGLNGVAEAWSPQIQDLAGNFKVIVHDQRGCGQSTMSRIDYSIDQMAQDVLYLMDGLGIETAALVGHSTGAAIGQVLASKHPKRLSRMVLASGWRRPDEFFLRTMRARRDLLTHAGPAAYMAASAIFLYPPDWVNEHAQLLSEIDQKSANQFPPEEIAVSRINAVMSFDGARYESNGAVRSLVIVAKDDILTPPHLSAELHASLSNSDLEVLDYGAHLFTKINAPSFNKAVLNFLLAD